MPPQSALIDAADYRLGNANPVRLGIAAAPVVTEQEPANNESGTAQAVTVPCEVVGQFYPAGDVDWVEFAATKGQILQIDVLAHRLGRESDPCLVLMKVNTGADGQTTLSDVASVDDPPERQGMIGGDFDVSTDDPSYRFVVPADAKYRLMLRDQFGDTRDDARFVYRLLIAPEQPDFRLAAIPQAPRPGGQNQVALDSCTLRRGGASLVKVIAQREGGFNGEIEITGEGLPAGVTCSGAVIGGDVSTAWLVFSAADNAPAGAGPIRIVGKSSPQGQAVSLPARSGAAVWGTPDRQQAAPVFRVTRDFVLSVIDQETAPAAIQVGDGNVVETSRGGSLELPVRVTRQAGFAGELKLVAEGMPNEIKPADITVGGGAADGKLAIALTNANAKPGTYTFYLRAEAKLKLPRNPNAEQVAAAEQKEIADALQAATDQVKQATESLQQATKTAQEAATALQQARQAKTDEAAIAAAEQKAKGAEEAKAQADAKLKELQETQKRADAAKKDADKRLDDIKKANQPRDVTWALASTPIKLRVRNAPFELAAAAGPLNLAQGAGGEVVLQLKKQFGFDDKVDISFEPPPGVPGLSAKNFSIEKGQAEGKLALTVDKNAPEGEHSATVRARAKFNNVNVEATAPVVIKIAKAGASMPAPPCWLQIPG